MIFTFQPAKRTRAGERGLCTGKNSLDHLFVLKLDSVEKGLGSGDVGLRVGLRRQLNARLREARQRKQTSRRSIKLERDRIN